MNKDITRRDFLKLSALGALSLTGVGSFLVGKQIEPGDNQDVDSSKPVKKSYNFGCDEFGNAYIEGRVVTPETITEESDKLVLDICSEAVANTR